VIGRNGADGVLNNYSTRAKAFATGGTLTFMKMKLCAALLLVALPLLAEKRIIAPPQFRPAAGAPAPVFSPGVLVDGTLYVSGQIGQDLSSKEIPPDFESEVKTCLGNIEIVLKAAGMSFDDVVAVQVYLTDMDLFQAMNAVYASVFKAPRPSRTTVGVTKLANARAHIEITVTARK
jgi:2-iminobutanoate/2-iminopropanoate deaminase